MERRPTIGILAHAGSGNLGDEATLAKVVAALKERLPNLRFQAYTMNPRDTEARHEIKAFPGRRGLNWATTRVVDGSPEPGARGREGGARVRVSFRGSAGSWGP